MIRKSQVSAQWRMTELFIEAIESCACYQADTSNIMIATLIYTKTNPLYTLVSGLLL